MDIRSVKLWETATARRLATLQGHTGEVLGVALSADAGDLTAVRIRGKLLIPSEEPERYLADLVEDARAGCLKENLGHD